MSVSEYCLNIGLDIVSLQWDIGLDIVFLQVNIGLDIVCLQGDIGLDIVCLKGDIGLNLDEERYSGQCSALGPSTTCPNES